MLENDIKEEEMNLEHKKNKLFKTKVVSLMLVVIAILHVFNYHETQKELTVAIRNYDNISHLIN